MFERLIKKPLVKVTEFSLEIQLKLFYFTLRETWYAFSVVLESLFYEINILDILSELLKALGNISQSGCSMKNVWILPSTFHCMLWTADNRRPCFMNRAVWPQSVWTPRLLHHRIILSQRLRIKTSCLTLRLLMSYTYGAPILDVSRSHTTTQHSR